MTRLALFIWLALAQAAFSQTAVVKSGDHPDFTRLVLELPRVAAWKLGRTSEGYELRIEDEMLRFDVSQVFKTIQRDRLTSIWENPATGGLRIGIACACHAMPFELRPGIIVIDLKDGPAPEQSAFEEALDGTGAAPLENKSIQRPLGRPQLPTAAKTSATTIFAYEWLSKPISPEPKDLVQNLTPSPILRHKINDVEPLKNALLWQLSRGASQGIVQMKAPSLSSRVSGPRPLFGPRLNSHLGEPTGFDVATTRKPADTILLDGAECIQDDTLNLSNWGTDQNVAMQLADSRTNLVGEFDRPEADNVTLAVKLLIYLGFGAEARQLLTQFSVEVPDRDLWDSMAKIVDGAPDENGPFNGMQACDTAAALWAALALPQFRASESPRPEAVLRAFSALPLHMRRNLGPNLVAKFLKLGDVATARSLSQAVQRGGPTAGIATTVMSATINLAAGDPAKAMAELEPALADAGPATAEALIALVDAKLATGLEIDANLPVAIAALIQEQGGNPIEPALRRAQILALAASGNFDQAFNFLAQAPLTAPDLWAILAQSGSDMAIMNHAVLPLDTNPPILPPPERTLIASRLLDLGLPDEALAWIRALNEGTSVDERIIAAKASLAKGDPNNAIFWLADLIDNSALELRAQALFQLDQPEDAAKTWAQANNSDANIRAQSWARDWGNLAKNDGSSFKAAAELVTSAPSPDAAQGPLAYGNDLVTDSEQARAILANLLVVVPALKPKN